MAGEEEAKIAWPPVVVIENAGLGDGTGLNNEEIRVTVEALVPGLNYRRVLALYGPQSRHLGVALVIFNDSHVGYLNAFKLDRAYSERHRGRSDWRQYKRQKSSDTTDDNPEDGKKDLYAYLASPEDMMRLDPKKNAVKRWSVESFHEKVVNPQHLSAQEVEKAKQDYEELNKQGDAAEAMLRKEGIVMQILREELGKMEERVQAENARLENMKLEHEEKRRERRRYYAGRIAELEQSYKSVEENIRSQFKKQKVSAEQELHELVHEVETLQRDIDGRKQMEKEIERLTQYLNDRDKLQIRMERELAKLEKQQHEKFMSQKAAHQKEQIELKKQLEAEREKMREEYLERKQELEKRINDAKPDLDSLMKNVKPEEPQRECVICLEPFKDLKMKALYTPCGHACVCKGCFPDVWKKNKACPLCRQEQAEKPKLIPAIIFE